ncbi:MAG: 3-oxo-tetronate kinase [Actinomycetota bacterium]
MSTEARSPLIGAIADDFTGATDVAVAFSKAGLRTVIYFGLPGSAVELPPSDAVVIALKSRTIEPSEATRQSLAAASWLTAHGAPRLFFKYCSTFDSTAAGNIGPVADALADFIDAPLTVVVPGSPVHQRRQFMGQLYVGQQLLHESPMKDHPLTPMTDSYIPRVLSSQTKRQVGLVDHRTVSRGAAVIAAGLEESRHRGDRYAVVDAIQDTDLDAIGAAVAEDPLITGAAGIARGVAAALARRPDRAGASGLQEVAPPEAGRSVVLAGSCSARTLEQIAAMERHYPSHRLDALGNADPQALAEDALAWFDALPPSSEGALIYSSLPPAELRAVQAALGTERASAILEEAAARIAEGLVRRDVQRLVVAGGETSGAVVSALDVPGGMIGPEADPGVPWIYPSSYPRCALLLKSGNFGDPDLFLRAVRMGTAEVAVR